MKKIVIYHRADFDGIFCREIAKKFLPDAELIGWDYGDPEPVVPSEADLYILDLSVPSLMNHPHLIWIDHHKSAIEKYTTSIRGYRVDGVAACRLAWQWFAMLHGEQDSDIRAIIKQDFIDRKVDEPLAVRLAGEYDIWDKRDPDAELFQHGLRSCDLTPHWPLLLSMDKKLTLQEVENLIDCGYTNLLKPDGTTPNPIVLALLEKGRALQYARTQENESIIKAHGYTVNFEGLTFLVCNHARFNSHLFLAALTSQHDACLGYCFDGKQWKISLYHAPGKEQHDLSVIAVKYGGGGHRGACGFRCLTLPPDLLQTIVP